MSFGKRTVCAMADQNDSDRNPRSAGASATCRRAGLSARRLLRLSRLLRPRDAFATLSAVSTRAADDCMARMMQEPSRARLTQDAALLLTHGIGLLLSPKSDRPGSTNLTMAIA